MVYINKDDNPIPGPYGSKMPPKYGKAMAMAIIFGIIGAVIGMVLGKLLGLKSPEIKYFGCVFIALGVIFGLIIGAIKSKKDKEDTFS